MNITLNKSSWHFKLYSNIFSDTPPKSLCPYFWSMVAIVVFSPFFLLVFIMKFLSALFEKKEKSAKKPMSEWTIEDIELETKRLEKKLKRSEVGVKIVLGISMILLLALLVISAYLGIKRDGWYAFFRAIFAIIGMCVSTYGILTLIGKNYSKIVKSNYIKVPAAMIKSIYTKACPIINWK